MIYEQHKYYDQGLLYFLSTDRRVPEGMRTEMASYGLCKDEFLDSDHWPVFLCRGLVGFGPPTHHFKHQIFLLLVIAVLVMFGL